MQDFFKVLKELSANQIYRTAVGIDGELIGQKAVFSEDELVYRTNGFPGEVLKELRRKQKCASGQELECQKQQRRPGKGGIGLLETAYGRVFVETLGRRKKIILCGGGHVSLATLAVAKLAEFHVTVLEDRPDFAQMARGAGADVVICDDFAHGLSELETDLDTYVVIMTRGHRHDMDCLKQILTKDYAYLGMMGSRSRVKKIREQLKEDGFSAERISGLHAPVGLPISAVTPAEIAVSVLAEIIQEKNQRKRQTAYEKDVAGWLFAEERQAVDGDTIESEQSLERGATWAKGRVALATIIARKGSAPRQAGTKMLIFPDGSSLGTIGGGCMEAEVKSQARHMLAAGQKRYATCFVDMTGREAEEEGMVCGGTLEIFLEVLD